MISRFLADVTEPSGGGLSPDLVGGALKMSIADMARVTRLHRNTLTHRPYSPSVQARVGEVACIVAAAAEMIGDNRAAVWFRHQPLAGFGGRTAEELVAAGHADAVLKHLDQLADGAYA